MEGTPHRSVGRRIGCGALAAWFLILAALLPIEAGARTPSTPAAGIRLADPSGLGSAWAESGDQLLVSELAGPRSRLWAVPALTNEPAPRLLAEIDHRPGYGITAEPAPAAPLVALIRVPLGTPGSPAAGRLEILDLTTGAARTVAEGVDPRAPPRWSPDGRRILVDRLLPAGPDRRQIEVAHVKVEGSPRIGRIARESDQHAVLGSVGWTADGRALYTRLTQAGTELWSAPHDASSPPARLAHLAGGVAAPARLSPDRRRLAFLASPDPFPRGPWTVGVVDLATGQVETIRAGSHPFWLAWQAPDHLVTGSDADPALVRRPSDALIAQGLVPAEAHAIAPDERWVETGTTAGAAQSPSGDLRLIDPAGGETRLRGAGFFTAIGPLRRERLSGGTTAAEPGSHGGPSVPVPWRAGIPPVLVELRSDNGRGVDDGQGTTGQAGTPAPSEDDGPGLTQALEAGFGADSPPASSYPSTSSSLFPSSDEGRCAETGARPYQPTRDELNTVFERAAAGRLGTAYPQMGAIGAGWPDIRDVPATIPCVLLKAIGYVESNWHQADYAVPRGSRGDPLINPAGCAYGVGQIATGMQQPGEIDRALQFRIADDYVTNVAYSARVLAEKWRITPPVGSNDPAIAEDWYYAVWAYNSFSFVNNPNNPRYDPSRPPFTGRQSFLLYPYQELVWGFAANPPSPGGTPLWTAVPLTLPDRASLPRDATTRPQRIPDDPQPVHTSTCPAVTLDRSASRLVVLVDPADRRPQTIALTVSDPFGASFGWQATASGSWARLEPSSGVTLPATLRVTVDPPGLPAGTTRAVVAVTAPGGEFRTLTTDLEVEVAPLRRAMIPWVARSAP